MEARRSIPVAVGALAAAMIALAGVLVGSLVHDDNGTGKADRKTGSATTSAPAKARKARSGSPGAAPVNVDAQQVRGTFASSTRKRSLGSKAARRRRAARARARKRRAAARRAAHSSVGRVSGRGFARRPVARPRARVRLPVRRPARRHKARRRSRPRRVPRPVPVPPVAAPLVPAPPAAEPAAPQRGHHRRDPRGHARGRHGHHRHGRHGHRDRHGRDDD
jgi:hypothetical protein